MKKIYTTLLGILIVVTLVTAGIIDIIQKDKEAILSKDAEQWYKDKGIILSYEDFEQEEEFWRCFINTADMDFSFDICSERYKTYQLKCILYEGDACLDWSDEKIYHTPEEKEKILDDWKEEILEEIAQVYLKREARTEKEIIRKGDITIKEKAEPKPPKP